MKRYLGIGLGGLLLLAAYLAWCHWNFIPTPPDEELAQTPRPAGEFAITSAAPPVAIQVEALTSTNVFDPERGKRRAVEAMNATPPERPSFELVGICALGDTSGAIIDKKNEATGDPKKQRRYYALGAEVGSGFVLDSVLEHMVILRRDGEVLELKVGRSRFGEQAKGSASLERGAPPTPVAEIVPAGAAEPVAPILETNGGTR